jgi:hypothetical protein
VAIFADLNLGGRGQINGKKGAKTGQILVVKRQAGFYLSENEL